MKFLLIVFLFMSYTYSKGVIDGSFFTPVDSITHTLLKTQLLITHEKVVEEGQSVPLDHFKESKPLSSNINASRSMGSAIYFPEKSSKWISASLEYLRNTVSDESRFSANSSLLFFPVKGFALGPSMGFSRLRTDYSIYTVFGEESKIDVTLDQFHSTMVLGPVFNVRDIFIPYVLVSSGIVISRILESGEYVDDPYDEIDLSFYGVSITPGFMLRIVPHVYGSFSVPLQRYRKGRGLV